MDLSRRTIIITGASSGIGAATAIACGRAGMNVVLAGRRAQRLTEVAEQVERQGGRAACVAGDISEEGHSSRLLDAADDAFASEGTNRSGGLYAVFANAGYGLDGAMHRVSTEQVRRIFDVNFFSGLDLLQQAAQRLLERGAPGRLLMCSSVLGRMCMPFFGAYCATKAAQTMACKAMNMELRPRGIFVSSVHPIGTRTEFHEAAARESGRDDGQGIDHLDRAPRMFVQTAERVANAVVKSLRKDNPPPEVWTSHTVRFAAGLMTMFPRLNDLAMRRMARQENGSA